MVKIRKAEVRDIPALHRMLEGIGDFHRKGRPDIFKPGCVKYTEEKIADILMAEDKFIFVAADDNDNAKGYIFCILQTVSCHPVLLDSKTFYVDDLFVDESLRKSGAGTLLMDAAKNKAIELDCDRIDLNVWIFPGDAIDFYEKYGLKKYRISMEMKLK